MYNATYVQSVDGVSAINESSTILQNVDIEFAGVSPRLDAVPALRASPTVPALINVTIRHSALDATNYSMVLSSTIIYNTSITNSRGTSFRVYTKTARKLQTCPKRRVTTCLENLEMSGNLEHVREMSGKKSCHGKVSQNCSLLDEY